MSIDTSHLLMKIAAWAEDMEKRFGESATLVDAMLVVEISHKGDGEDQLDLEPLENDENYSYVDLKIMSGRDVVARGLYDRIGIILDQD